MWDEKAHQGDLTEDPFLFRQRLKTDWKIARTALIHLQEQQAQEANKRRRSHCFKVGDEVLVNVRNAPRESLAPGGVLDPRFAGPYRIVGQVTENSFWAETPRDSGKNA